MKTEQMTIMEITKETHSLVLFYLSFLKDTDTDHVFEVNHIPMNSASWITAHLCNTADMLFFKATGIENPNIPSWLSQYGIGSNPKDIIEKPSFQETYSYMNDIYNRAYEIILQMSDQTLNIDNKLKISFGEDFSIRKILYHQIRHEATHAGNFAWLCKFNGIKII